MAPDQQNNQSNVDTAKIPKVTQEMIDNFSDPKPKAEEEEVKDAAESEESASDIVEPVAEISENPSEDKTVVEFVEDEAEEQKPKVKKERKPFFVLKFFIFIIFLLIIGAAIFGIWNRWFRYDDEAQLISNWQINGSNAVVVIDKETITLNSNTILNYTVDTGAKVINYTIGDMSGQSHYRFSWDRNQLALCENTSYDPISTIISDLGWFWDWSTCGMSQIDLSPAYTKNNKTEVDTENTGIEDIIINGKTQSILLDRISTKKTDET